MGDELRIPHILEEKENATLVNPDEVGIGAEARCVPNFYARMCKVSPSRQCPEIKFNELTAGDTVRQFVSRLSLRESHFTSARFHGPARK